METIYRQLGMSKLSPALRILKNQKDFEYKAACEAISNPFYQKKRSIGVTPEEEQTYLLARANLWDVWKAWAISAGVYEVITPEQYLAENEASLNDMLTNVNFIRGELNKTSLELKTKVAEV